MPFQLLCHSIQSASNTSGNPNYLGEMMLYGSYAILAQHAVPWLVLSYVWGLVFMSNMIKKEVLSTRCR